MELDFIIWCFLTYLNDRVKPLSPFSGCRFLQIAYNGGKKFLLDTELPDLVHVLDNNIEWCFILWNIEGLNLYLSKTRRWSPTIEILFYGGGNRGCEE